MTSTVSVVIPCHNYAHFLPMALDSVLRQRGVEVDVIVVDDASTDDSVGVAEGVGDGRVKVVRRTSNGGPVAAFNDGLARARGDYLVRLDADDLLTAGALERATALLEVYPGLAFAYGRPLHFRGDPPPVTAPTRTSWNLWSGRAWLERRFATGVNCITSPEVVMRRTAVDEVGGQRPELAQTHDMEMWMRLATVGDVGIMSGAVQALHREHDNSRSAVQVDPLVDLCERAAAFELLLDGEFARPWMAAAAPRLRYVLARQALERVARAYDRGRAEHEPVREYLDVARRLWHPLETHGNWRGVEARLRCRWPGRWRPTFQVDAIRRRGSEERLRMRRMRSGV